MTKAVFLNWIPHLYLSSLLNFFLFYVLCEGIIKLFRIQNKRLQYSFRSLPYLKALAVLMSLHITQWVGLKNIDPVTLAEKSRVLTLAVGISKGLSHAEAQLLTENGSGFFFTLYDVATHYIPTTLKWTIALVFMVLVLVRLSKYVLSVSREIKIIKRPKQQVNLTVLRNDLVKRLNDRRVILYSSSHAKSPFSYGILRPKIVLPKIALDTFTQKQINSIIEHELAHLSYFYQLLTPLFKFVSSIMLLPIKQLELTLEQHCDESALKQEDKSALLNAIKFFSLNQTRESEVLVNRFARSHPLIQRFKHIIQYQKKQTNRAFLIVHICLLVYFFLFVWKSQITLF